MRVCITGAGGMLGQDLCERLGPERAIGLTRADVDITDAGAIRAALERIRPAAVVNCAAFTRVDDCETYCDAAYAVNADGAGHVAAAAMQVGAALIHVSTDYVLDGTAAAPTTEDAGVGPLSVYGQSKLAGERAVVDAHPQALVLRTAWLFGRHGPNFVETILRLADERNRLTIVDDQQGSPTFTRDLADAIVALLSTSATGFLNVTNGGACSWYDFARFILHEAGVTGVEVLPITTTEFARPAPRPAYSVLDCSRYASLVGAPLRPWQDAVREYLALRQPAPERAA